MDWRPDKKRAVCPQICEHICAMIALGELKADDRILSVRETALSIGVNPNTVQKAFEILENESVLYSVKGSGWYVKDVDRAKQGLDALIYEKTKNYFASMSSLGQDIEAVKNYVKEWYE